MEGRKRPGSLLSIAQSPSKNNEKWPKTWAFSQFCLPQVAERSRRAEGYLARRTSLNGRRSAQLWAKWLSKAKLGGILQDSPTSGRSGETGRRAGLKIPWGHPP